jgi:hypothetical protein
LSNKPFSDAEIGNTGLYENAVNAIKRLSAGGEVKVNMPHRIYQGKKVKFRLIRAAKNPRRG